MPQVGVKYAGRNYTWDEARAMAEDPNFPFPPPLIEAMADQRDDEYPTASVVTGCMRQFQLKRTTDYYGEAAGELPMLFGTAFHDMMDRYRKKIMQPGDLAETRLSVTVEVPLSNQASRVIPFSGKMDYLSPGRLVSDWKSKLYIPQGFTPPKYHEGQVNIYNWLGVENGYASAPTWELAYVSQSWSLRFQGQTTSPALVGNYVRRKLTEWAQASHNEVLPDPVPQLFQSDAKGKPLAPCAWCPVREQCLAALKNEGNRPF